MIDIKWLIIYFKGMRYKDEAKQNAIVEATVKLVNQIGFAATSTSKIAKEANVSSATIYIYYKNKEDLLISTYVDIKNKMGEAVLKNFDDSQPIRDILKNSWLSLFTFISVNPGDFHDCHAAMNITQGWLSPWNDSPVWSHKRSEQVFPHLVSTQKRDVVVIPWVCCSKPDALARYAGDDAARQWVKGLGLEHPKLADVEADPEDICPWLCHE